MKAFLLPQPSSFEASLAKKISGANRQLAEWRQFASGEWFVRVKGMPDEAVVVGRFHPPADNFLCTNLLVDTLRRNGARKIRLVLPYFGYARQDRAVRPGDPVSADFVVRVADAVGADSILTAELHTPRLKDVTPVPIVNVSLIQELALALRKSGDCAGACSVLAPDRGAKGLAEQVAKILGCHDYLWVEKKRDQFGRIVGGQLFGQPQGDSCVIVDDMVDSGGTVRQAARLARQAGFRRLCLCATHAVLSDGAPANLRSIRFQRIVFSDTLPLPQAMRRWANVTVVGAARFLADAVRSNGR